jgi:hypothetical protein
VTAKPSRCWRDNLPSFLDSEEAPDLETIMLLRLRYFRSVLDLRSSGGDFDA